VRERERGRERYLRQEQILVSQETKVPNSEDKFNKSNLLFFLRGEMGQRERDRDRQRQRDRERDRESQDQDLTHLSD
jgi:hypothetical protein